MKGEVFTDETMNYGFGLNYEFEMLIVQYFDQTVIDVVDIVQLQECGSTQSKLVMYTHYFNPTCLIRYSSRYLYGLKIVLYGDSIIFMEIVYIISPLLD